MKLQGLLGACGLCGGVLVEDGARGAVAARCSYVAVACPDELGGKHLSEQQPAIPIDGLSGFHGDEGKLRMCRVDQDVPLRAPGSRAGHTQNGAAPPAEPGISEGARDDLVFRVPAGVSRCVE